ncbi:MAG: hypothetical protein H7X97_06610 [Opitutaceae bacterium]|nr:hypothetical protein [Verrucomicrobiales bacterium]
MKKGTRTWVKARGFSLVEITLALGIASFALMAIMGLLSLTLTTSKSSMDDTLLAKMTGDLVNTLRKQDFSNIQNAATNVYFDISGKRLNSLNPTGVIDGMLVPDAVSKGAIYECAPVVTADTTTLNPDGTTPNLWLITLKFRWPAGVTSTVNQKKLHADIARY